MALCHNIIIIIILFSYITENTFTG